MATVKYPIGYELHPTRLAEGEQWVWLDLENASEEPITDLTVTLISQDASRIRVIEPDNHVPSLTPEEREEVGFEVEAKASTGAYVSISGEWDGAPFRWESPYIQLSVGETVAKVASLVATGPRYPPVDEPVRLEAIVRTFGEAEGLRLALWVDAPSGDFQKLAETERLHLHPGEEHRYVAVFTPDEKGSHTVYAYLYDEDERRIDRWMEHIYVT